MPILYRFCQLGARAALALAMVATGVQAAEHVAHEHGSVAVQMQLDHGKKWGTDPALRTGMDQIRSDMASALHPIHAGTMSTARYAALAKRIEARVGAVVAQCHLAPEADAQLHQVIAALADGAEAMQGKRKNVTRHAGAQAVLGALDNYATYFDHPNWAPVEP
jgi:hypothetical protein